MDEPLSNLDAKLREDLRFELRQLQGKLKITTIYVTHDQIEALAMSNQIAIMHKGKIVQQGSPREIIKNPTNQFTADFIGSTNFFYGVVEKANGSHGNRCVNTAQGRLDCNIPNEIPDGASVRVTIRPRNIQISEGMKKDQNNVFCGRIIETAFLGDYMDCQLELGNLVIRFYCDPKLPMNSGDSVCIYLPYEFCTVIQE